MTPVMAAAVGGHRSALSFLISAKADVNFETAVGRPAPLLMPHGHPSSIQPKPHAALVLGAVHSLTLALGAAGREHRADVCSLARPRRCGPSPAESQRRRRRPYIGSFHRARGVHRCASLRACVCAATLPWSPLALSRLHDAVPSSRPWCRRKAKRRLIWPQHQRPKLCSSPYPRR